MARYSFRNKMMEKLNLSNGADAASVRESSLNTINARKGNDRITVISGMCINNKIYGGDGDDVITINRNALAHDTIIRGGNGRDTLRVSGLQNSVRIYGDAGNDTIIVTGKYKTNSGETYEVYSLAGEYVISGGDGSDSITINGGEGFTVSGGVGNDRITVNSGSNHIVRGGDGNDRITSKDITTLSSGGDNLFDGGRGNDTITVYNNSATVKGGPGSDVISIRGGNVHDIYTGSGRDTLAFFSTFTGSVCKVYDYGAGDIFKFTRGGYQGYEISGSDAIVSLSRGGKITILGGEGKTLKYKVNDVLHSVKLI